MSDHWVFHMLQTLTILFVGLQAAHVINWSVWWLMSPIIPSTIFSDDQMHCAKALEKLGLARLRVSNDAPEEGRVWHYGPKGRDST